jgi:hypothetical protein
VAGSFEHVSEFPSSIKCWKFLQKVSKYRLYKKGSALWIKCVSEEGKATGDWRKLNTEEGHN